MNKQVTKHVKKQQNTSQPTNQGRIIVSGKRNLCLVVALLHPAIAISFYFPGEKCLSIQPGSLGPGIQTSNESKWFHYSIL